MAQKRDRRTRELVEYAVGAILCDVPEEQWAATITDEMKGLSQEEKGDFLANLAANAINTLAAIVELGALQQQTDPVSYWASHVKLTTQVQGE